MSTLSVDPSSTTPEARPAGGAARRGATPRLVVRAVGRRLVLVGDPTVADVEIRGEARLRRRGTTLEVVSTGDLAPTKQALAQLRNQVGRSALGGLLGSAGGRLFGGSSQGAGGLLGTAFKGLDLRSLALSEVTIRVNPSMVVEVELAVGSLTTSALPRLARVRCTAGSAQLSDVARISEGLFQAGNLTLAGPFDGGRSRVRVESGNVTLALGADADVEVHATSQLGRVVWPGGGGALHSYLAGEAGSRLELEVLLGSAHVTHESAEGDVMDDGPDDVDGDDAVEADWEEV